MCQSQLFRDSYCCVSPLGGSLHLPLYSILPNFCLVSFHAGISLSICLPVFLAEKLDLGLCVQGVCTAVGLHAHEHRLFKTGEGQEAVMSENIKYILYKVFLQHYSQMVTPV